MSTYASHDVQVKHLSPESWTDGTFLNLTNAQKYPDLIVYDAVINGTKFAGLEPYEILWLSNLLLSGRTVQCATGVRRGRTGTYCYDPDLPGEQYKNQLSITGPVRDDFCDKVTRNATHVIDACCLDERSKRRRLGKIIGEYRILFKDSVESNRWQYYRACIDAINKKNGGCYYNAFWVR
ncbi:hypothetical protein P879_09955 [Paragonimus westermani]|uniref:Uncharacterized protein n=1 Tax=Paragonimus westermani TaxID=34504 RepID=A0A8T0D6R7_9TREM|nr:hypothetical protein P879_09955 [Paragonimus westermani]